MQELIVLETSTIKEWINNESICNLQFKIKTIE